MKEIYIEVATLKLINTVTVPSCIELKIDKDRRLICENVDNKYVDEKKLYNDLKIILKNYFVVNSVGTIILNDDIAMKESISNNGSITTYSFYKKEFVGIKTSSPFEAMKFIQENAE